MAGREAVNVLTVEHIATWKAHGDDTAHGNDDQSDDDDTQGEDDPREIHIIDGRYYIWPAGSSFGPSRTAVRCVYYVIQQMYKEAWTTFGDGKCTWDQMSEKHVKKNYYSRTSKRLSDKLRRVRKRWERDGSRPKWMGQEVFDKVLVYWKSEEFKVKSENAKKMRASEKGGHLNADGSISTYEHSRRMAKRLERQPLMVELVKETRTKKSGDYVDELVGGKEPNGCFFGGGNLAGNLRSGDRTLFERVRDGEGSSRPAQLSPQVMETIRQLALTEARRESEQREAALKAQMDEKAQRQAALKAQMEGQQQQIEAMAKRQAEMEQQMRLFIQFQQRSSSQPFGGNVGVVGNERENDDKDMNLENFPDPDDP
ncbi:uncharacterized protein LOC131638793 [Vicia villosa]|uniref:uncharacterized protein LOC131638793 n=1 Tax=Vicia villosa TaxID=3911 RepID=UPI00273A8D18|nr:uncharacterized protein LOC131638793 [Vicia villosa]